MITIKRFTSIVLTGTIILLASCKKNNEDLIAAPGVIANSNNAANDTMFLGDTLKLHPTLTNQKNLSYRWTVNGKQAGTDSIFSYVPTSRGDNQIAFTATNAAGSVAVTYQVHVFGKYENGFFLINEGWFGHGTGGVNYFDYGTQTLRIDSVYLKENPGKTLDPASSTLEYGTIFNNQLYLVSKVGGPIVVTDAYSLKEVGRVAAVGGNNWQAFVGIDSTHGLVTAASGVFPISLPSLTIGTKLTSVTGSVGDVIKSGNYIFVLSQTKGVVILNASDYSVAKTIAGITVAFTRTTDGSIWAAGGTSLLKINPTTLDTLTVKVPFTVNGTWFAWHPGSITASTTENALYIANNGSFSGGKTIYKYIVGNAASLQSPFITIDAGKEMYGSAVGYDASRKQLVVTTVKSGFGANYGVNNLVFYDAITGVKVNDISYDGYYFPAIPVFH